MVDSGTAAFDTARRIALASDILAAPPERLDDFPGNVLIEEFEALVFPKAYPPFSLGEAASTLADRVRERADGHCGGPDAAMAAMLLRAAWEWPCQMPLRRLPGWLLQSYTRWRLSAPSLFTRIGVVEEYAAYLCATVDEYHAAIATDDAHPEAVRLVGYFTEYLDLTPLYFDERHHAGTMRKRARLYEIQCLQNGLPLSAAFTPRPPARRLRVGMLLESTHPNAETYYAVSHLEHFPRDALHVVVFHQDSAESEIQSRLFSLADKVVALPRSDLNAVGIVRGYDLDVMLVMSNVTSVLNGTTLYSLFRLARLQAVTTASPLTTGITNIDVYIGGDMSEPPGDPAPRYTERFEAIPGAVNYYAYQYDNDPKTLSIDRASLGIPAEAVLYASSSNYFKITPELVASWARILRAVPDSRLLLMPFGAAWGRMHVAEFLQRNAEIITAHGVSAARVHVIRQRLPTRADLETVLRLGDVYLDSYPFSGACSLICPFQAGLPIVEREGPTFRSRVGSTMLRMAGLSAMVFEDEAGYEARAIALGRDASLRAQNARQAAQVTARGLPFFDSRPFSTSIAALLQDLCARQSAAWRRLMDSTAEDLMRTVTHLSRRLAAGRNHLFTAFDDAALLRLLVLPWFEDAGPRRLLEIGSPADATPLQFLQAGWNVDMVEPDPHRHAALGLMTIRFPGRARHHETLAEFAGSMPDLAFVHAGSTNPVLPAGLPHHPDLIVLECGEEDPETTVLGMQGIGYQAMVLCRHVSSRPGWDPRRRHAAPIGFGTTWKAMHDCMPATIVFFRPADTRLLAMLTMLLDSFEPGRERSWLRPGDAA